jgi:hypothetical protein
MISLGVSSFGNRNGHFDEVFRSVYAFDDDDDDDYDDDDIED